MKTHSIAEVKTHLSAILKAVEAGEEIGITYGRSKKTIAVLIPEERHKMFSKRILGSLEGKMKAEFKPDFKSTEEVLFGL